VRICKSCQKSVEPVGCPWCRVKDLEWVLSIISRGHINEETVARLDMMRYAGDVLRPPFKVVLGATRKHGVENEPDQ